MKQEYIDKIVSQYPINTFSKAVQNELREVLEAVYKEGFLNGKTYVVEFIKEFDKSFS